VRQMRKKRAACSWARRELCNPGRTRCARAASPASGTRISVGRPPVCLLPRRCGRSWSSDRAGAGQRGSRPAVALALWPGHRRRQHKRAVGEEPAAIGDRLENALDEAWHRDAHKIVDRAIEATSEGRRRALGWAEVLDCLVQHRVEHLVFAVDATPTHPKTPPPYVSDALGRPSAGKSAPLSRRSPPAPTSLPSRALPDDCFRSAATLRY
jgi:hypothetical protein